MSRRPLALAAALAGSVLMLAGCATAIGGADATTPAPAASAPAGEMDVAAAWLDGGATIGVVTWGSSTCLPSLGGVALTGDVITVDLLEPSSDAVCTMDYVARGVAVPTPTGVDSANDYDVEVRLGGARDDADLDGVAGLVPGAGASSGAPSAGWTGEDGLFALLTWGSSGCPPVVQEATASAPGEIAVTFVEPDADRVCTADMAARVTVVQLPDLDDDVAYEAVLTGDGLDGIRVPIVGEP